MAYECACQCKRTSAGRLAGSTSSARRSSPSRAYVQALGASAGYADPERLARLEAAGMPPFVAAHVLTYTRSR
jgi:hypothetical protein